MRSFIRTGKGREGRGSSGHEGHESCVCRPQRFLVGQSATLWPGFPHPWQTKLEEGR